MPIHEVPICFSCEEQILYDPVFAAPCDHEDHPSVVFHPLCLMEYRENRERRRNELNRFLATHRVNTVVEVEHLHE